MGGEKSLDKTTLEQVAQALMLEGLTVADKQALVETIVSRSQAKNTIPGITAAAPNPTQSSAMPSAVTFNLPVQLPLPLATTAQQDPSYAELFSRLSGWCLDPNSGALPAAESSKLTVPAQPVALPAAPAVALPAAPAVALPASSADAPTAAPPAPESCLPCDDASAKKWPSPPSPKPDEFGKWTKVGPDRRAKQIPYGENQKMISSMGLEGILGQPNIQLDTLRRSNAPGNLQDSYLLFQNDKSSFLLFQVIGFFSTPTSVTPLTGDVAKIKWLMSTNQKSKDFDGAEIYVEVDSIFRTGISLSTYWWNYVCPNLDPREVEVCDWNDCCRCLQKGGIVYFHRTPEGNMVGSIEENEHGFYLTEPTTVMDRNIHCCRIHYNLTKMPNLPEELSLLIQGVNGIGSLANFFRRDKKYGIGKMFEFIRKDAPRGVDELAYVTSFFMLN